MVDLKKLITGFLLLAILVSSFIFIFSSLRSPKTEISGLEISSGAEKNPEVSGVGNGNPFFESLPLDGLGISVPSPLDGLGISVPLPDPVGGVADENPELPPARDPNNLTDNLAQKLTEEMATLDPSSGNSLEGKVNETLLKIDSFADEDMLAGLAKDLDALDKEVKEAAIDLRIKTGFSADDVLVYGNAINSILEENFSRFSSMNLAGEDMTSPLISSLELAVNLALMRTKDVETPEAMVPLHRELLRVLTYQKKFMEMVKNEEDPIRSVLVFDLKEQEYSAAIENLGNEYNRLKNNAQSLGVRENGVLDSLASIFSVKKAHAIFGFTITFSPKEFFQQAKKWLKDTLGEMVKKRLVKQIVNQTINWIQGGGKPRFIRDFKGFVLGEADKALGGEIYKHFPQLCSPIAPWVKSAFYGLGRSRGSVDLTEYTRCTLTMAVENVKAFYESFGAGGWKNYLEAIRPQNNAFGSIMILSDIALTKESEEKEAAKTSAQASGGLLATRKCVDVRRHSISAEFFGPPSPNSTPSDQAQFILAGVGETAVDQKGGEIDVGKITGDSFYGCPQDGWQITTPGTAVGGVLDKALGADLDWIISTTDLKALAAAFVDSLVNKLFTAGVEGLVGTSTRRVPLRETAEKMLESCELIVSSTRPAEYQECLADAKEIIAIYESIALDADTLKTTANSYMASFSRIIALNNEYLYNAKNDHLIAGQNSSGTIFLISDVLNQCTQLTEEKKQEVNKRLLEITSSLATVALETKDANSSVAWLLDFIIKVDQASSSIEFSELTQEIQNRFDPEMVSMMLNEAQQRMDALDKSDDWYWDVWKSRNFSYMFGSNKCDYDPP